MTVAPFIAEWLLPPILVALVASGIAFKFRRRRQARPGPDGWREVHLDGFAEFRSYAAKRT
jgi:hypothetical protein